MTDEKPKVMPDVIYLRPHTVVKNMYVSDDNDEYGATVKYIRTPETVDQPSDESRARALVELCVKGKEAANYLIRELNFADMDTPDFAGAGAQHAHAELLDILDKLGHAALAPEVTQSKQVMYTDGTQDGNEKAAANLEHANRIARLIQQHEAGQ